MKIQDLSFEQQALRKQVDALELPRLQSAEAQAKYDALVAKIQEIGAQIQAIRKGQ